MGLQGLKAVVTGSSSGIGRAIALGLAKKGCAVAVHGFRSMEKLRQVAREIESCGVKSAILFQDLRDADRLEGLVNEAASQMGSIDIWVNNAGADVLTGSAATASFEQKLRCLWETDVAPTILLTRLVGSQMWATSDASSKAGKYSIINMGWDQAWQGMAGDSGEMFAAAKGAIMAATKSLAQSLAPLIRVNCVAPGWIRTAWGSAASPAWQRRAQADSLMRRWGEVDDVAHAVCFLASPESKFVSGQIWAVNGGFRYDHPVAEL